MFTRPFHTSYRAASQRRLATYG